MPNASPYDDIPNFSWSTSDLCDDYLFDGRASLWRHNSPAAPAHEGAQNATAQSDLHMDHGIRINPAGRVENHTADNFLKHPIDYANMEMHMLIEARAEAVNESECADVHGSLVHMGRPGAVGLQSLRDHPWKMRSTMLRVAPSRCMK